MEKLIILLFLSGTIYSQDTTKKEVYTIVETMPEPEGGIQVFRKYLAENIRYPDSAQVKGIVELEFLKRKTYCVGMVSLEKIKVISKLENLLVE